MPQSQDANIIARRLGILELAKKIGNVSKVCKLGGISRSQFYEYKRRYEKFGREGLADRPPIHKYHPATTSEDVKKHILETSLEHPTWGCNRINDKLKLDGIQISSITIHKILNRNEMSNRYVRWLKLEKLAHYQQIELSGEQVAFLEKQNPAFKEKHNQSNAPGELLCHDTSRIFQMKNKMDIYLHIVVDTYCSLAFTIIDWDNYPEITLMLLRDRVLPFYRERDLSVKVVTTNYGMDVIEKDEYIYDKFLKRNNIEHRFIQIRPYQANGFIKRFKLTVLNEFYRKALPEFFESMHNLRPNFEAWVDYYNKKRSYHGYRNYGMSPLDRIDQFLS